MTYVMLYPCSIFLPSISTPHSTKAIAATSLHMVLLSSNMICWSVVNPVRLQTISMYRNVLFSCEGAHVLTMDATVSL